MKRSVQNLKWELCKVVGIINSPHDLHKFDMNKVIDSDDEINTVKRKPRTKDELAVVRPWQNKIMTQFLDILFRESLHGYLVKSSAIRSYNETGVPISWPRIGL